MKAKRSELKRLLLRSTHEARSALRAVQAAMSRQGRLGDIYQEDLIMASWLWMSELDPDELARGLAPYVEAVRSGLEEGHRGRRQGPGFGGAGVESEAPGRAGPRKQGAG